MSASISRSGRSGASPVGARCTLRVQAVFRDLEEQQAHAIAAEMIDRAHELANLPECECDVDVSVQVASPQDAGAHGERAL